MAWPALKSCNHKFYRTSADEPTDRLSQLPDEILLAILSSFTMKEAARASVLSRKWNYLWRCFPAIFNFEDASVRKRIIESRDRKLINQEISHFVGWVNQVVEGHLGLAIDELKVTFALDKSCQCHVDKWVAFAFTKQVKRLELDFTPILDMSEFCTLPIESCKALGQSRNFCSSIKPSLTSLCLSYVNVTAQVIDYLLNSCPSLENLEIAISEYFTCLRVSGSLQLKHLKLINCRRMEIVDISAPKLQSFTYFGPPTELHIRNAYLLSKMSVGGDTGDPVEHAFDSLSEYLPRLEYLALSVCLYGELNLGINHFPTLTHLKHLELDVEARCEQSLLGWIPLIEASPVLQKLTLKLDARSYRWAIRKDRCTRRPIKCLETLEIIGFIGRRIDIEFATYVIENAIMLKEVIVDFVRHVYIFPFVRDPSSPQRLIELQWIIPQGVQLVIK